MSTTPDQPDRDISPITIEEEMQRSYLDYAMSVIVSRALPDVRDGLKPVHRRILYAMKENGYTADKPYRKSARIVGDVMGKYHPHGDQAIYDAMVRMAQTFSMRLPLIDGQGNFGSMDGDAPAAMRYTEARLAKSAEALLRDIDKDTVDFQPTYDDADEEPVVLPAEYPNLLVNGAGGIAVGMATNIPPHNLGEVIDGAIAFIDNPDIALGELMELIPGPDFPTGGLILGRGGILEAYTTGRGSVIMRGRHVIEPRPKDREAIIFTEIPYQVNKSRLLERIAECVREKQIEGVSEVRDESDRDGVRVVIELKRDASSDVVLNQVFRFTPLQGTFGVNSLAINAGRPEMLNLRAILKAFCAFREEVITRRTAYELGKARERAHSLIGLALAVANLDEVIALIRKAANPQVAREELLANPWPVHDLTPLIELVDEPGRGIIETKDGPAYQLSEEQAKAILELRLHRLTGLERDKIGDDLRGLVDQIADFLDILANRTRVLDIMRAELLDYKEKFADPRRTTIQEGEAEYDIEALIEREDMVVTVSHRGYVKRVPLSTYRAQGRGGKGRAGMSTRDEDFVSSVYVTDTHTPLLFFTSRGMAHTLKVWRLPLGTPQARGKPLVNLLPLDKDEWVSTVMPMPEDEETWGDLFVMFATSDGGVRRNSLADFTRINRTGKIAMKFADGSDVQLISVKPCAQDDDVLLATRKGRSIRFPVGAVRVFTGRSSTGVRGIRLGKDDAVVSMSILNHVDASPAEREDYIKAANAQRRLDGSGEDSDNDETLAAKITGDPRFAEMAMAEQFILSLTENGFGKRTSAFEYPQKGRGGQGVLDIDTSPKRNGNVVGTFPVEDSDELVLVSDGGQIIRVPVADISMQGRRSQGVRVFDVEEGEKVVSVSQLSDEGDAGEADPDSIPETQPEIPPETPPDDDPPPAAAE